MIFFFFFNDTATTEIYTYGHTLSLHDALPIWSASFSVPLAADSVSSRARFSRLLVDCSTPSACATSACAEAIFVCQASALACALPIVAMRRHDTASSDARWSRLPLDTWTCSLSIRSARPDWRARSAEPTSELQSLKRTS